MNRINPLTKWGTMAVTLLWASPLIAQTETKDPAGAGGAYGRTPDRVAPYRHFREPYKRFFLDPLEFKGAGREKEPTVLPQTVRLGFFAPLADAPDADLGQDMLDGVTLAIEQANAAGGYQGIPFELIVRPDLAIWGASSNEMVAFKYEDDVLAVIGSIDGANTHIALRVVLKTEMLLVNTGDTDPTLTETRIPWLMRCMADDRQQGYALAHHVFDECGLKKVVAFRVNSHYGRMGIAEFRDAASRLKRPLLAEWRWNYGDRDFTSQLDRIAEMAPEAIVLWGSAADAAAVVNEIRRRGMDVRLFGCDRLVSDTFLQAAGANAEGVVAAATYDPTREDPKLDAFARSFTARFGHRPGTFAAHGYDGANLLVKAIQKAGLNCVRVRDAMYAVAQHDGVTGSIVFDATMNDVGPVYLAEVRGGRFVYREATFGGDDRSAAALPLPDAQTSDGNVIQRPYRVMAESPPAARSPEHETSHGTFRIGCFLPLDEAGQATVRGIERALAEDRRINPHAPPIELLVRDARGSWGGDATSLVDLVFENEVLAVIGSTERRGTHLVETLAAKMHFPVLALCGDDPTVNRIPLPWVFNLAAPSPASTADLACRGAIWAGVDARECLGYDAGALLAFRVRDGRLAPGRRAMRAALADGGWYAGVTGTFRFDGLGRRIDQPTDGR